MLEACGISRNELYITNVSKFQPPYNDFSKLHLIGIDIDEQVKKLWAEEIEVLKPNCILALGRYAMRAIMGWPMMLDEKKKSDPYSILNYRGSIMLARDNKTKVVSTIHPAALFNRQTSGGDEGSERTGGLPFVYKKLIEHDIRRAYDESATTRINLPARSLSVCNSSLDASRYFTEYRNLSLCAVDIESINCVPVCVGFAFNKYDAISIPLLRKIGKVTLTEMGIYELEQCWRLIDETLRRIQIIGHNFKYDEFKLGLIGFGGLKLHSDTLIKTRVLFPELPTKGLATAASIWTREPFWKEEGKEFKLGKSPIGQLLKYNAKDCAVDFEVDEAQEADLIGLAEHYKVPLKEYYYDYMMKKHAFYLKMENTGFNVDHKKQAELKVKYTKLEKEQHEILTRLVGEDINVKSYPQVHYLLYKLMKFKLLKKDPTSEDAIVRLLTNHVKTQEKKDILETLLEERRIRDQKSRYINFHPDYDDRCKTSFNISATETCRSSTSVPKKPIRPTKLGLAFHTISKHGRLAKDIRSMFIPDRGKIFLQADSSQAEARVVAVLARDFELLKAFDTIDIHRRTAGLVFSYCKEISLKTERVPIVDELDKDGPERFVGKKVRHAGNYNMGKGRFMLEFNTDAQKFEIAMRISEWRAGQMLDLFHAASPKIKGVFHAEIIEALNSGRVLIDPFGGVRVFNGRLDDELYKEGFANIPQRTVAHLVQGAGIKCFEEFQGEDVQFISENHDALLLQVPENGWEQYARVLRKYMTVPIDFSKYCTLKRDIQLTIPCDIEISDTNYGEMRKVKVSA
jgi:uracil-DNA glycosylase family 4